MIHLVDVSELEQTKRRLVKLLSSKDQFIASVAHEIRTPLTAVLGYADILKNGFELSPEDRDAMVSTIIEQATDLSNLVEDLLVAARLDTDNLTVAQVPVDLLAQAAQVVESLQSDHTQTTITGSRARANGDPGRVRQILRNFLTNALRYGGSDIRIEIDKDQAWARIAVTDNGPGVPPEDEARIFDAYQTAHTTKARTGSIGLGLSIAVRLAQLMNGAVAYRRHQGRTIFELSLPRATESSLEAGRAAQG